MNNTKSHQYFVESCQHIPGGVNSPVRAFKGVGGEPIFIEQAQGAYLTSVDGDKYIDYIGSWGPMIAGHNHPVVIEAVKEAVDKGLSFGAPTVNECKIAQEVKRLMPSMEMLRFVNSGTEATMSALRLARAFTKRNKLIKFEGCYHGHADSFLVKGGSGMLTMGNPSSPGVPTSLTEHTIVLEYNNSELLETFFATQGNEIAAVILEPVAGNMNCIPATQEFMDCIHRCCQKYNSILIFDEVMTGFRVALSGAQSIYQIKPDLTVIGKIIGGGLPVGAFGGRADIMAMLSPSGPVYQAGTLSGNPIATVAGLATLQLIQEKGFYDSLNTKAQRLLNGIHSIADENGVLLQSNQVGAMFGLFFGAEKPITHFSQVGDCIENYNKIFHSMLQQGIYLAPSGYEAIFISQAHDDNILNKTLLAFSKAIESLAQI